MVAATLVDVTLIVPVVMVTLAIVTLPSVDTVLPKATTVLPMVALLADKLAEGIVPL